MNLLSISQHQISDAFTISHRSARAAFSQVPAAQMPGVGQMPGPLLSWKARGFRGTKARSAQRGAGDAKGHLGHWAADFFPGQMDGYKIIIYKSSAQVFQASRAVYNRCLGDRCTMTLFLLVWFLHQKGAGCYSASPDAIWFGHHGYSQSCKGCDHKQRCSTGSPRTSHCLSRFQCLDYWLACLASGR